MTERLHCDAEGCEAAAHEEVAPGWLVVDTVEPFAVFGEDGPWHFCSYEHLALWALATADRKAAQP